MDERHGDFDLERVQRELKKLDKIIRGDPERDKRGMIETLNHLENEINKFNRIFDKDYLGQGGLVSFVTYLYNKEKGLTESQNYKWPFWATVLAAAISLLATGLTHRDDIMKWLPKTGAMHFEQMFEKPKRPARRFHKRKVAPKPILDDEDGD